MTHLDVMFLIFDCVSFSILDEDYSSEDEAYQLVKRGEEPEPQCTKIIYATRTHSQLQQFAAEVMKTRSSVLFRIA